MEAAKAVVTTSTRREVAALPDAPAALPIELPIPWPEPHETFEAYLTAGWEVQSRSREGTASPATAGGRDSFALLSPQATALLAGAPRASMPLSLQQRSSSPISIVAAAIAAAGSGVRAKAGIEVVAALAFADPAQNSAQTSAAAALQVAALEPHRSENDEDHDGDAAFEGIDDSAEAEAHSVATSSSAAAALVSYVGTDAAAAAASCAPISAAAPAGSSSLSAASIQRRLFPTDHDAVAVAAAAAADAAGGDCVSSSPTDAEVEAMLLAGSVPRYPTQGLKPKPQATAAAAVGGAGAEDSVGKDSHRSSTGAGATVNSVAMGIALPLSAATPFAGAGTGKRRGSAAYAASAPATGDPSSATVSGQTGVPVGNLGVAGAGHRPSIVGRLFSPVLTHQGAFDFGSGSGSERPPRAGSPANLGAAAGAADSLRPPFARPSQLLTGSVRPGSAATMQTVPLDTRGLQEGVDFVLSEEGIAVPFIPPEKFVLVAAYGRTVDVEAALLRYGRATLDAVVEPHGMSALHFAVRRGNEGMVDLLLRAGANPNVPSSRGFTPLALACKFGHTGVAEQLLAHPLLRPNALVTADSEQRMTPLLWACLHADPRLAATIGDKARSCGVDPAHLLRATDRHGASPLALACAAVPSRLGSTDGEFGAWAEDDDHDASSSSSSSASASSMIDSAAGAGGASSTAATPPRAALTGPAGGHRQSSSGGLGVGAMNVTDASGAHGIASGLSSASASQPNTARSEGTEGSTQAAGMTGSGPGASLLLSLALLPSAVLQDGSCDDKANGILALYRTNGPADAAAQAQAQASAVGQTLGVGSVDNAGAVQLQGAAGRPLAGVSGGPLPAGTPVAAVSRPSAIGVIPIPAASPVAALTRGQSVRSMLSAGTAITAAAKIAERRAREAHVALCALLRRHRNPLYFASGRPTRTDRIRVLQDAAALANLLLSWERSETRRAQALAAVHADATSGAGASSSIDRHGRFGAEAHELAAHWSPLHHAARSGVLPLLDWNLFGRALTRVKVNRHTDARATALQIAVWNGQAASAAALVCSWPDGITSPWASAVRLETRMLPSAPVPSAGAAAGTGRGQMSGSSTHMEPWSELDLALARRHLLSARVLLRETRVTRSLSIRDAGTAEELLHRLILLGDGVSVSRLLLDTPGCQSRVSLSALSLVHRLRHADACTCTFAPAHQPADQFMLQCEACGTRVCLVCADKCHPATEWELAPPVSTCVDGIAEGAGPASPNAADAEGDSTGAKRRLGCQHRLRPLGLITGPEAYCCCVKSSCQALAAVDQREAEGYRFQPQPIDTSNVDVPLGPGTELGRLVEQLAANAHDVWAQARIAQGWTYGRKRDDRRKVHPALLPMRMLSDEDKSYDRGSAVATIKVIRALGYAINPPKPAAGSSGADAGTARGRRLLIRRTTLRALKRIGTANAAAEYLQASARVAAEKAAGAGDGDSGGATDRVFRFPAAAQLPQQGTARDQSAPPAVGRTASLRHTSSVPALTSDASSSSGTAVAGTGSPSIVPGSVPSASPVAARSPRGAAAAASTDADAGLAPVASGSSLSRAAGIAVSVAHLIAHKRGLTMPVTMPGMPASTLAGEDAPGAQLAVPTDAPGATPVGDSTSRSTHLRSASAVAPRGIGGTGAGAIAEGRLASARLRTAASNPLAAADPAATVPPTPAPVGEEDDGLGAVITGEGVMISDTEEYVPRPIDTSAVKLTPDLSALIELQARNLHNLWAQSKIRSGWRYAPASLASGNDADRTSPLLVPWEFLDEREKGSNRVNASETIKVMLAKGYTFELEPGRPAIDPSQLTKRIGEEEAAAMRRRRTEIAAFKQSALDAMLLFAAQHGVRHMIEPLLVAIDGRAARVNTVDSFGRSPLYRAVQHGRVTACKVLLAWSADVEQADGNGMTPLAVGAHAGQLHLCKLLLETGAQYTHRDALGLTPVHWAAWSGNGDVLALLAKKVTLHARHVSIDFEPASNSGSGSGGGRGEWGSASTRSGGHGLRRLLCCCSSSCSGDRSPGCGWSFTSSLTRVVPVTEGGYTTDDESASTAAAAVATAATAPASSTSSSRPSAHRDRHEHVEWEALSTARASALGTWQHLLTARPTRGQSMISAAAAAGTAATARGSTSSRDVQHGAGALAGITSRARGSSSAGPHPEPGQGTNEGVSIKLQQLRERLHVPVDASPVNQLDFLALAALAVSTREEIELERRNAARAALAAAVRPSQPGTAGEDTAAAAPSAVVAAAGTSGRHRIYSSMSGSVCGAVDSAIYAANNGYAKGEPSQNADPADAEQASATARTGGGALRSGAPIRLATSAVASAASAGGGLPSGAPAMLHARKSELLRRNMGSGIFTGRSNHLASASARGEALAVAVAGLMPGQAPLRKFASMEGQQNGELGAHGQELAISLPQPSAAVLKLVRSRGRLPLLSPLTLAVHARQHDAARILLKFGSVPTRKDGSGQSPYERALLQHALALRVLELIETSGFRAATARAHAHSSAASNNHSGHGGSAGDATPESVPGDDDGETASGGIRSGSHGAASDPSIQLRSGSSKKGQGPPRGDGTAALASNAGMSAAAGGSGEAGLQLRRHTVHPRMQGHGQGTPQGQAQGHLGPRKDTAVQLTEQLLHAQLSAQEAQVQRHAEEASRWKARAAQRSHASGAASAATGNREGRLSLGRSGLAPIAATDSSVSETSGSEDETAAVRRGSAGAGAATAASAGAPNHGLAPLRPPLGAPVWPVHRESSGGASPPSPAVPYEPDAADAEAVSAAARPPVAPARGPVASAPAALSSASPSGLRNPPPPPPRLAAPPAPSRPNSRAPSAGETRASATGGGSQAAAAVAAASKRLSKEGAQPVSSAARRESSGGGSGLTEASQRASNSRQHNISGHQHPHGASASSSSSSSNKLPHDVERQEAAQERAREMAVRAARREERSTNGILGRLHTSRAVQSARKYFALRTLGKETIALVVVLVVWALFTPVAPDYGMATISMSGSYVQGQFASFQSQVSSTGDWLSWVDKNLLWIPDYNVTTGGPLSSDGSGAASGSRRLQYLSRAGAAGWTRSGGSVGGSTLSSESEFSGLTGPPEAAAAVTSVSQAAPSSASAFRLASPRLRAQVARTALPGGDGVAASIASMLHQVRRLQAGGSGGSSVLNAPVAVAGATAGVIDSSDPRTSDAAFTAADGVPLPGTNGSSSSSGSDHDDIGDLPMAVGGSIVVGAIRIRRLIRDVVGCEAPSESISGYPTGAACVVPEDISASPNYWQGGPPIGDMTAAESGNNEGQLFDLDSANVTQRRLVIGALRAVSGTGGPTGDLADSWTVRTTSALSIDFSVFSPEYGVFVAVRLFAFFPGFGGAYTQIDVRPAKLFNGRFQPSVTFEAVLFAQLCVQAMILWRQALRKGVRKWLASWWNIYELCTASVFIVVLFFDVGTLLAVRNLNLDLTASGKFFDVWHAAGLLRAETDVTSLVWYLFVARLVKYM